MIVVLAGGVGAAKYLEGLQQVVPAHTITAIVNTADDFVLHGLAISPDLDTVTYRLAGQVNPDTGWGRAGESWAVMDELERYGGQTWFRLGDLDLAIHLFRTQRRNDGATLTEITAEITAAWGVEVRLLPMTDGRVATRLDTEEGEMDFQDWFVGRQHSVPVRSVSFDGTRTALPGPEVLDAIEHADRIVVAPSNPIVSIGPILAIPGVREALRDRRRDVVAISPIVGGRALKGPADRLLVELGHRPSAAGVAGIYAEFASALVIDTIDGGLAAEIEATGMTPVVTPTIMYDVEAAAELARTTLLPTP